MSISDTPTNNKNKYKIYEGSNKIIYQTDSDFTLRQFFKDEIKLSNKEKLTISGKGVLNNKISSFIMQTMDLAGIDNHFIETLNMREQLVQMMDVYPVIVQITNVATGRYVKDFGIEEGFVFEQPMMEFRIKNGDLDYPIINEEQIYSLGWMSKHEIKELKRQSTRVYDFLIGLFAGSSMRLVDTKLEFGRMFNGEEFSAMLVDEITPDNCRIWDIHSNKKLDHEAAAENPENAVEIYQEVAKRFNIK